MYFSMIEFLQDPANIPFLIVILIWSLIWKGMALWRSARTNQKNWFVVLLCVNTIGLLEIIYLWKFATPEPTEEVTGEREG